MLTKVSIGFPLPEQLFLSCASELVTQVNLVTASLGLVILHAADRYPVLFRVNTVVT